MKVKRSKWFLYAIFAFFSSVVWANGHYQLVINSNGKEIEKIHFTSFTDQHVAFTRYGLFFEVKYRDNASAEIFGYEFDPQPSSESEYKKILLDLSQGRGVQVVSNPSNIHLWHDDKNDMTESNSSTTFLNEFKSYIRKDLEMSLKTEFKGPAAVIDIVIKDI